MSAQEHGFKAEVQQLLSLMIHSVYSDREVFLRELVSNAADALDKVRFLALTRQDLREPAHPDRPGIRIQVDEDRRQITLEDDGIGMTEAEVVENLGTIAKSGTRAFLEQVKDQGGAPKLIGQFGLGFYSSFMVATEVVVDTLSAEPDAAPVRWRSEGAGTFSVEPGERTHRGTTITLTLREDASEFGQAYRLRSIVTKHSNYLPWPVFVGEDQANSGKALWAEPPSQVTEEEANAFYRSVAVDWQEPALRVHLSADSPFQYHALMFVPSARPYDLFYPEMKKGLRLYARRVLIDEHAKDLLPDWLRFVRGVLDSEDIPLNVSREMVQKTPVLRKIRDALVKRLLKDLAHWADRAVEEGAEPPPEAKTYPAFYRNFGVLLKEGYYHEKDKWGELLLPLLRFNTTHHGDERGLSSLAEIKARLPEGQDTLWYLTAESRAAALASPHLEAFRKKGWEVLLLTDTVDEWFVQSLEAFDGVTVKSVARGELALDEASEADKADVADLAPWMQGVLGDEVAGVRASSRLTDSACVLVDADEGLSANMERILRSANQDVAAGARRVLELNPSHPLVRNLAELRRREAPEAEWFARLMLDDALLLEGTVKEPAAMGRRLQELLVRASGFAVQPPAAS